MPLEDKAGSCRFGPQEESPQESGATYFLKMGATETAASRTMSVEAYTRPHAYSVI